MLLPSRAHIANTALDQARVEWEDDIRDTDKSPESLKRITSYIEEDGLGWRLDEPYHARPQNFQWCGAFATRCLRAADWHPRFAKYCGSSTYRLDNYGRYVPGHFKKKIAAVDPQRLVETYPETENFVRVMHGQMGYKDGRLTFGVQQFHETLWALLPDETKARLADPTEGVRLRAVLDDDDTLASLFARGQPLPGDIALVGTDDYGQHVTLVRHVRREDGVLETFEGNAYGLGPKGGALRYGVVKTERPIGARRRAKYHVRRIIRPSIFDFLPADVVEYVSL